MATMMTASLTYGKARVVRVVMMTTTATSLALRKGKARMVMMTMMMASVA
jgi:hypothetical protein